MLPLTSRGERCRHSAEALEVMDRPAVAVGKEAANRDLDEGSKQIGLLLTSFRILFGHVVYLSPKSC